MPPKRERTVEGSCWPCKQRRIKCDLLKPKCRRCLLSGALCSYDKIRVRWSSRPTKGLPPACQMPGTSLILSRHPMNETLLATNERRALEYFQAALWPLFTTSAQPCPPPISLALQSQPVLLTMCELAEAHRALGDTKLLPMPTPSETSITPTKRLDCLASVREQLHSSGDNTESLSRLLVAVLLLYFLDGYIDCAQQSASTGSHQAGVRAIVENLGGFRALIGRGSRDTNMLLSEFASTDLTRSLLDDRLPCFPADIWDHIETGTVWWEKQRYGETTLASVFHAMAEMAFYRQSVRAQCVELSVEQVRRFESVLQPSFVTLGVQNPLPIHNPGPGPSEGEGHGGGENGDWFSFTSAQLVHSAQVDEVMQPVAFTRAFQHSALIYLYRAVCGFPARHYLVQQHVQSCLECIKGISRSSKAHNCIIFPLYVVGAHAFSADHQSFILSKLDVIYQTLRFNSLLAIRAALEDLWVSPAHEGEWSDMFTCLGEDVLVL